jgi:hypothetical protein
MVVDLEGKAFDPVVVKAAVDLHARGQLALPTTPNPETKAEISAVPPEVIEAAIKAIKPA